METIASAAGVDIHGGPAVVDPGRGRIVKLCRYWPAHGNANAYVRGTPRREMAAAGWVDRAIVSQDDGATWGEPAPIEIDWPTGARNVGCGNGTHGIVLAGGTLAVAGGFTDAEGQTRICLLLSDDGERWRIGAMSAEPGIVREFVFERCSDDSLYFNSRTNGRRRLVARGDAGGESMGPFRPDDALVESVCHAGLTRCTADGAGALAFSNPAVESVTGRCDMNARRRLTVRLSRDDGRSWSDGLLVDEGASGYSDLACVDGRLLCLYESGPTLHDTMTLARIDVEAPA